MKVYNPSDEISNLQEELFSPSEICSRLDGVTPRQITDLAEKSIIIPAKDTLGQGSKRLYDLKNIHNILIALALRGMVSIKDLKCILQDINNYQSYRDSIDIQYDQYIFGNPKTFINIKIDMGEIKSVMDRFESGGYNDQKSV